MLFADVSWPASMNTNKFPMTSLSVRAAGP